VSAWPFRGRNARSLLCFIFLFLVQSAGTLELPYRLRPRLFLPDRPSGTGNGPRISLQFPALSCCCRHGRTGQRLERPCPFCRQHLKYNLTRYSVFLFKSTPNVPPPMSTYTSAFSFFHPPGHPKERLPFRSEVPPPTKPPPPNPYLPDLRLCFCHVTPAV